MQGLDARIAGAFRAKTQVEDLFPYGEKTQTSIFGDKPQADSDIGPAAADALGDSAMVADQVARGGAVAEHFILALPGT